MPQRARGADPRSAEVVDLPLKPFQDANKTFWGGSRLSLAAWWLRECCAVVLWAYVFINALAFSVDEALRSALPAAGEALRFKGLVLLCVVAAAWLLLGNRSFWATIGYIVSYPLIMALWKIPKRAALNWTVVVAFLPALYELSKAFRRTFVMAVLAVVCAAVVLVAESEWVITAAVVYLLCYLTLHYARRFLGAFSRSSVFTAALGGLRALRSTVDDASFLATRVDKDGTERSSLKRVSEGFMLLSALRIAAERLQEVSDSRRVDLYLISSLAFTLVMTTVGFALVYVGVHRQDPGAFSTPGAFGFWPALGYSFSTLMTADLMGVQPMSALARSLSLAETSCAVLLLILLAFVVLTSIRERYRADLARVVKELRAAVMSAGDVLEAEFSMTLREMEVALTESDPTMMRFLARHDTEIGRLPQTARGTTSDTITGTEEASPRK